MTGCTKFGIWWNVALPLAKPVLAVVVVFNALNVWNEYLLALLIFDSPFSDASAGGFDDLSGGIYYPLSSFDGRPDHNRHTHNYCLLPDAEIYRQRRDPGGDCRMRAKGKITSKNLKVAYFLLLSFGFTFLLFTFAFADGDLSSSDLITKAWAAQGEKKFEAVFKYTQECIDLYKEQADKEHSTLKDYPAKEQAPLSDVAVAYFIQAEALMRQGRLKEAREKFQFVFEHYRYAVAWDPSREFIGRWPKSLKKALIKSAKSLADKVKSPRSRLSLRGLRLQLPFMMPGPKRWLTMKNTANSPI